jgi:2-deoxy-D-gluconate 3-dehydrogenase
MISGDGCQPQSYILTLPVCRSTYGPFTPGKIINIASLNSFIGGENVAPYTASKGGVSQLTKALSNEWARHNVQVNALAPGFIATDM